MSGAILFVLGSALLAVAGFESAKRNKKLHFTLSKIYFVLVSIGGLLLTYSFISIDPLMTLAGLFVLIAKILGMLYYSNLKNYFKAEMWGIIFSTAWALILYTMII